MIKHYVEFIYPGFFSESSSKELKDGENIIVPDESFGYRTYDVKEVKADGETLTGQKNNISGWVYIGRLMTLEDVKREMPGKDILIANMKCNGWNKICWTKFGQAIPMNNGDKVI